MIIGALATTKFRVFGLARMQVEAGNGARQLITIYANRYSEFRQAVGLDDPVRQFGARHHRCQRVTLSILMVENQERGEVGVIISRRIEDVERARQR